jgi:hypothetical protein
MAKDLIKYSTTQAYASKARVASQKAVSKLARHYKKYARPTTKIVRGVGRFARGATKLALRAPGTGLALTAAYYGAKAIAGKQKGLKFPTHRQFNRRGRKII